MEIMIGLPVHRPVELPTFISCIRLANHRGLHRYTFSFVQNSLIYTARETIVREFLKSNCEALMFIDSDMSFEYDAIERLEAWKVPYVTAKAFKRAAPFQPCFYTKVDFKDGEAQLQVPMEYPAGLIEIQGSGMACSLIRREVFEEIASPYFEPLPVLGEDLTFCLRLKQEEVPMYCDTTVEFKHVGINEIGEEHYKYYIEKFKKENHSLDDMYL